MILTATPHEAAVSAENERLHMQRLARLVEAGVPADVIADLMDVAAFFDPLFGLELDDCAHPACPNLVTGHDYCSSRCEDDDAHALEQQWRGWAA